MSGHACCRVELVLEPRRPRRTRLCLVARAPVLRDLRSNRDLPAGPGDPLPESRPAVDQPEGRATRRTRPAGSWRRCWGRSSRRRIAMALATPIGVGVAVWLSEYAPPALAGAGGGVDGRDVRRGAVDRAGAVRRDPVPRVVHGLPHREERRRRLRQGLLPGRRDAVAAGAAAGRHQRARGPAGGPQPRARGLVCARQDQDRHDPARAAAGGAARTSSPAR